MPNQADKYLTDQGVRDRFGQVNPQGGKAPGGTGILRGAADKVSAFLEGLQNFGFNQNVPNQSSTRPDFAGQIFEEEPSGYPTALDSLGGLGGGSLDRFNKVHPAGGMPAPGGTGIGSKLYDYLQGIGFGTK